MHHLDFLSLTTSYSHCCYGNHRCVDASLLWVHSDSVLPWPMLHDSLLYPGTSLFTLL